MEPTITADSSIGQRGGRGHEPGQKQGGSAACQENQGREPENVGNGLFINDACQIVHEDCKQGENDAGKNGDDIAEMETLGDERGHPCGNSLPQHPLQQDAEQNDQQKS